MRWKKGFLIGSLVLAFSITPSKAKLPSTNPLVYDQEKKAYKVLEGGVAEGCLQDKVYHEWAMINYLQRIDSVERAYSFSELGILTAEKSKIETMKTKVHNFELIAKIDQSSIEEIAPEYMQLKEMLIICNFAVAQTERGSINQAALLYNTVTSYVHPGQKTNGSVHIEDILNGQLSDCNDVAPALDAILKYYGFGPELVFGWAEKGESKEAHAWIRVKAEGQTFDLDPTWYSNFVPLGDRCLNCEAF